MSEAMIGIPLGMMLFLAIFGPMFYVWYCEDHCLPKDPRRWRIAAEVRRMREAGHRISLLEHDLGYTPCSDPDCWTCRETPAERQWRYHGSRIPDPRLTKSVKR